MDPVVAIFVILAIVLIVAVIVAAVVATYFIVLAISVAISSSLYWLSCLLIFLAGWTARALSACWRFLVSLAFQ